jgi:hypothetical protein
MPKPLTSKTLKELHIQNHSKASNFHHMPPTQFEFSKKPDQQDVNPNPQIPTKNFRAKSEIWNQTQRTKQNSQLVTPQTAKI